MNFPDGRTGLPYEIAVLDDDARFLRAVKDLLGPEFSVRTYGTWADFSFALEAGEPDLLLLDLNLGEGQPDGFEVYERLGAAGHLFPVVLLTIAKGLGATAAALRMGLPFLQKDDAFEPESFRSQLQACIRSDQLQGEVAFHRRNATQVHRLPAAPWPATGRGAAIRARVESFCSTLEPLLLSGEIGTGKHTTARWIHDRSAVAQGPFVECSARGRRGEAVLRELFGEASEQGAPTLGTFGAARWGTLFLKGMEELPVMALEQLRLALESGYYFPAGGSVRKRLACRFIGSRLREPGQDPWPASLEAFWEPQTVSLAPLAEHAEDAPFHAEFLRAQARQRGDGRAWAAVRDEDLIRFAHERAARNFYDLRTYLVYGDAPAPRNDPAGGGFLDRLAELDWRSAVDSVEREYLKRLGRRLGRDPEAWQEHTLFSRAKVYTWFARMDEEGLWEAPARPR